MRKPLTISATVACLLGMAMCGAAMAKQYHQHRHYRSEVYASEGRHHPLVVERRSFLDPALWCLSAHTPICDPAGLCVGRSRLDLSAQPLHGRKPASGL